MKMILCLTVFVLLNSLCTATEPIKEDNAAPDTEVADVTDVKEFDEINDDTSTETSDIEADVSPAESEEVLKEQVLRSHGVTITLLKNGNIGISLGGVGSQTTAYTRWGKRSCRSGAKLLYNGYVGGGHYSQKGNGANYLCLPRNPQYLSATRPSAPSYLYGTEYESYNKIFSGRTHDYNVPCAVCQVQKSEKLMMPARVSCPSGWTREYYGYLMTSHVNHPRIGTYECIDARPDLISGSARNTNGALFYFVQAQCGVGLPCRPYITNRAITCAVCTK